MSRYHSYVNTAKQILGQYKGEEPFASFLKKFFSQYKKFGSKDRKQISHLCYCYFRLGKSLQQISIEERILAGLFLCSDAPVEILRQLKAEWNASVHLSLQEKFSIPDFQFSILNVFPWQKELSGGIDHQTFCESFFVQPGLFIRLRPGNEERVKTKLMNGEIHFNEISSSCLSLPNATKIENVIELDREAVIQDMNSQGTGEFLKSAIRNLRPGTYAWDCCAASGGKSLMLYDIMPGINLTVSDVRESILINLKKRFEKAGIRKYDSFVADLSKGQTAGSVQTHTFDLIICDAPCTGSGTWSRTPEQLYFFDELKIDHYASLQKKIVSNVIPYLKENGAFAYITCSVFKKENEEVVDFIKSKFQLELIKMELLKGYDKKADTMYIALFRRSIA